MAGGGYVTSVQGWVQGVDCFLLILVSNLSLSYEFNPAMAYAPKFEFLSICRSRNRRSWLQNRCQMRYYSHLKWSDINPCKNLLTNQKNWGSGQRPISYSLAQIIDVRSLIWHFCDQPEPPLSKNMEDFIIEQLQRISQHHTRKNQQSLKINRSLPKSQQHPNRQLYSPAPSIRSPLPTQPLKDHHIQQKIYKRVNAAQHILFLIFKSERYSWMMNLLTLMKEK